MSALELLIWIFIIGFAVTAILIHGDKLIEKQRDALYKDATKNMEKIIEIVEEAGINHQKKKAAQDSCERERR